MFFTISLVLLQNYLMVNGPLTVATTGSVKSAHEPHICY